MTRFAPVPSGVVLTALEIEAGSDQVAALVEEAQPEGLELAELMLEEAAPPPARPTEPDLVVEVQVVEDPEEDVVVEIVCVAVVASLGHP